MAQPKKRNGKTLGHKRDSYIIPSRIVKHCRRMRKECKSHRIGRCATKMSFGHDRNSLKLWLSAQTLNKTGYLVVVGEGPSLEGLLSVNGFWGRGERKRVIFSHGVARDKLPIFQKIASHHNHEINFN